MNSEAFYKDLIHATITSFWYNKYIPFLGRGGIPLLQKFNKNLIEKNDSLLIAVSGGIDSMVLLHYLLHYDQSMNLTLTVAHVDHQKRKDSYLDHQLIEDTCNQYGLVCYSTKLNYEHHQNFHQFAHEKRYDYFVEIARKIGANKIVLAHNSDDNAETILMRIVRGSSFEGYRGILPKITYDGYTIVRPLLYIKREEIAAYQKQHLVPYNEDSSNQEDDYTRNRYRHHVLPLLEQENPKFLEKFQQFSQYLHDAYYLIEKDTKQFLKRYLEKTSNGYSLQITPLIKQEKIIQLEAIKQIVNIVTENLVELSYQNLSDILDLFHNTKPHVEITFTDNLYIHKSYETMYFSNEKTKYEPFKYSVLDEGKITLPDDGLVIITKKPNKYYGIIYKLCYNNLDSIFPLTIRNRGDGDKVKTASGTKKIKDMLINKKIPMVMRNQLPLVLNKNQEIIFIPNVFKAKNHGDHCIYIIYQEGNQNA